MRRWRFCVNSFYFISSWYTKTAKYLSEKVTYIQVLSLKVKRHATRPNKMKNLINKIKFNLVLLSFPSQIHSKMSIIQDSRIKHRQEKLPDITSVYWTFLPVGEYDIHGELLKVAQITEWDLNFPLGSPLATGCGTDLGKINTTSQACPRSDSITVSQYHSFIAVSQYPSNTAVSHYQSIPVSQ